MFSSTLKFFKNQQAEVSLIFFSVLFYTIGSIVITVEYITNGYTLLIYVNFVMLASLITALFFLFYTQGKQQTIYKWALLPMLANMLISIMFDVYRLPDPTLIIFRDISVGIVISVTSAFTLKSIWTYSICTFLTVTFAVAAFILNSPELISNILVVGLIQFGICFATERFVILFKQTKESSLRSQQEVNRLTDTIEYERKRINTLLKKIKDKSKDKDIKINNEIEKLFNKGVTDLIFDYAKESSRDENIFFNLVLHDHPDLTINELRLAFFLANNNTSKEIAEKISCTPNSVKVFRSRLRKKCKIKSNETLNSYFKQYL